MLLQQLIALPSDVRALNPVIHPGRADVIGGGAVAVEGIMQLIERNCAARSFFISEKDILDGIIAGLAEEGTPR